MKTKLLTWFGKHILFLRYTTHNSLFSSSFTTESYRSKSPVKIDTKITAILHKDADGSLPGCCAMSVGQ